MADGPTPPGGRIPGPGPGEVPGERHSRDLRPAVFLDRDGTLVVEHEYLADPGEVELVPGATEALRALRRRGYVLVVTTNQSGIARGYYTEADYRAVAARIEDLLDRAGAPVDATYFCPHHPEFGEPCACRKPGTGMHREASRELGLAPERSWFVGDKVKDVLPARALGGRGILVLTGFGRDEEDRLPEGVPAVRD
ncbi:MAG: HAD-IIIA family hydrolase, partial [Gemmatimonadetes bacterium]|nr:HAD family hydrolase [Gemmatimonadota bacterium]NIR77498.1 HAD family hydrolase [Gemmatimonadota bacterium]NIT86030.1 HAD family hydrolase [Gemmatimonadota bacterium]NIU29850.1 HAD family hydrolase [Gemmatimonadota bacterium]NIU34858.1 HAD-IIIA family hydrolase [Gemmatimonadota bacterium]